MITPAYAPTATERVLPRLALDFTTASLDPRVIVARALNTATVTNENGSISIVNADLPRFDFLNGVCRGILIEETRTNLLLNSVFAGAVAGTPGTAPTNWTNLQVTGTIASVSAGIYAAGNAIRITNTGTRRSFYRLQALSTNTTYTYSTTITVHSTPVAGFPRIQDCMNLVGGPAGSTVTYLLNGTAATATTAIPNGQTSKVVAIIAVGATAGNVEVRWGLGVGGTVDGDVSIQMPQLEAGAFATSYIPTTTTSLTRNADDVPMTGTNFSSWWQVTTGGILVRARQSAVTGIRPWAHISDGTADNIISLRGNAANPELYIKATTDQAQIDAGTLAANTSYGLASAWNTNDCAAAINGGTAVVDTSVTIPTVDRMLIGSDGTNYLNGWVEKIAFWPQRIINAEVQAFSK